MPAVTATYESPAVDSPHTISASVPDISSTPSTDDRVAYLAGLQSAVRAIQGDINTFLTQKMDEDKAASKELDDAKFEENYGEEVVDAE